MLLAQVWEGGDQRGPRLSPGWEDRGARLGQTEGPQEEKGAGGTQGRGERGRVGWEAPLARRQHSCRLGMTGKAGGSSPWRTPATPQDLGSSVHCEITRVILNDVSERNGFEVFRKTSREAENNRKENEIESEAWTLSTDTHACPQLAPAHPTSSPVPVAAASPSPGRATWTMTVGTAPMSQPRVVSETAGQPGWHGEGGSARTGPGVEVLERPRSLDQGGVEQVT